MFGHSNECLNVSTFIQALTSGYRGGVHIYLLHFHHPSLFAYSLHFVILQLHCCYSYRGVGRLYICGDKCRNVQCVL